MWTEVGSVKYKKAVVKVNNCYRQLCEIDRIDKFAERKYNFMKSSSKAAFMQAIKSINGIHRKHIREDKIKLPKMLAIPKVINVTNESQPKRRDVKQKESTLRFGHNMLRYQIRICVKCRENKYVMVDSIKQLKLDYKYDSTTTCYNKNLDVPGFFLLCNCQPVWYKHEDDGSYALDTSGNKQVHYDIQYLPYFRVFSFRVGTTPYPMTCTVYPFTPYA